MQSGDHTNSCIMDALQEASHLLPLVKQVRDTILLCGPSLEPGSDVCSPTVTHWPSPALVLASSHRGHVSHLWRTSLSFKPFLCLSPSLAVSLFLSLFSLFLSLFSSTTQEYQRNRKKLWSGLDAQQGVILAGNSVLVLSPKTHTHTYILSEQDWFHYFSLSKRASNSNCIIGQTSQSGSSLLFSGCIPIWCWYLISYPTNKTVSG